MTAKAMLINSPFATVNVIRYNRIQKHSKTLKVIFKTREKFSSAEAIIPITGLLSS